MATGRQGPRWRALSVAQEKGAGLREAATAAAARGWTQRGCGSARWRRAQELEPATRASKVGSVSLPPLCQSTQQQHHPCYIHCPPSAVRLRQPMPLLDRVPCLAYHTRCFIQADWLCTTPIQERRRRQRRRYEKAEGRSRESVQACTLIPFPGLADDARICIDADHSHSSVRTPQAPSCPRRPTCHGTTWRVSKAPKRR